MATTIIDCDPTIRIKSEEQVESGCLTILFAETVYANLSASADDPSAVQPAMGLHEELVPSIIQKHRGQVVKTMGRSVMAEFSDPIKAISAAIEMERLSAADPMAQHDPSQGLRIGIYSLADHRPEIEAFGSMVKAAANITKEATSGQILISNEAYQRSSRQRGPYCQWFRSVDISGGMAKSEDIFEVSWQEAPLNIPSRYEVLAQVGKGGMGIVHKVRDRETDEIIALKILKPEIAGDPAMQENLRREVCLARKVTHKNICRIHEFNRSNGAVFISMEFVMGQSLHAMLHRTGPLSWSDAAQSALQICAGLREAHIQGIVHRDLKPANIMIDAAGCVKVMDFGIARMFQGTGQLTGTMVGTPAYMAPEQLELKRVDARTDIYALGLLLYEMVTGLQPFAGETPIAVALKHLRETPKRPRELMPTLPPYAEGVILKCLQKDPAKRFQSVDELTMALKREAGRRPAVSHWNCFVADFRRAGKDLQRGVQVGAAMAQTFLAKYDWRALTPRLSKKAIIAGLGTALVLSGVIVFSASRGKKGGATGLAQSAPVTAVGRQSPPWAPVGQDSRSQVEAISGTTSVPSIVGFEVDLNAGSGSHAPQNVSGGRTKSVSAPANPAATPSESKATRNKQNLKAPAAVHASSPTSTTAQSNPTQQPPSVMPVATAELSGAEKAKIDDSVPDVSTTEANASAAAAGEKAPAPSASAGLYLEVGSFKDSNWADHAVEKLTQLGFQSASVRKAHLWMQSFQVRVGPFANLEQLEEARMNLTSQGFKPHPVK